MLSTLCDAADDAGGGVAFDGPPHLEAMCRPIALRRAAANLIGNAVSYGGGGTVRLGMSTDGLQITVEDCGPGIPDGELERVFEPFHRLEASRNRGTGGVGLGLTIARQSVAEQGGTLTLANRPGGGLLATIKLPTRTGELGRSYLDLPAWERPTSRGPGSITPPSQPQIRETAP